MLGVDGFEFGSVLVLVPVSNAGTLCSPSLTTTFSLYWFQGCTFTTGFQHVELFCTVHLFIHFLGLVFWIMGTGWKKSAGFGERPK
jgi:hypothetical protein